MIEYQKLKKSCVHQLNRYQSNGLMIELIPIMIEYPDYKPTNITAGAFCRLLSIPK